MNFQHENSKNNDGFLSIFWYAFLWLICNVALILFLISCWKFGPLTKRGDIVFFAFLHLAVLIGLYKVHRKYYVYVTKIIKKLASNKDKK